MEVSVTFSAKTVLITSTRSKTGDVMTAPSSTSGILRDTCPLGDHTEPRGAEENNEINVEGAHTDAEVLVLTQANHKRLEDEDPLAAALAFVVSSLPPSETTPILGLEDMTKVANANVKLWRREARKRETKGCGFWTVVRGHVGRCHV